MSEPLTAEQVQRVERLVDKSLRFAGWTAYPADADALTALLDGYAAVTKENDTLRQDVARLTAQLTEAKAAVLDYAHESVSPRSKDGLCPRCRRPRLSDAGRGVEFCRCMRA